MCILSSIRDIAVEAERMRFPLRWHGVINMWTVIAFSDWVPCVVVVQVPPCRQAWKVSQKCFYKHNHWCEHSFFRSTCLQLYEAENITYTSPKLTGFYKRSWKMLINRAFKKVGSLVSNASASILLAAHLGSNVIFPSLLASRLPVNGLKFDLSNDGCIG